MGRRTGCRAGYRAAAGEEAVFTGTRAGAGLVAATAAVLDDGFVVDAISQQAAGAEITV